MSSTASESDQCLLYSNDAHHGEYVTVICSAYANEGTGATACVSVEIDLSKLPEADPTRVPIVERFPETTFKMTNKSATSNLEHDMRAIWTKVGKPMLLDVVHSLQGRYSTENIPLSIQAEVGRVTIQDGLFCALPEGGQVSNTENTELEWELYLTQERDMNTDSRSIRSSYRMWHAEIQHSRLTRLSNIDWKPLKLRIVSEVGRDDSCLVFSGHFSSFSSELRLETPDPLVIEALEGAGWQANGSNMCCLALPEGSAEFTFFNPVGALLTGTLTPSNARFEQVMQVPCSVYFQSPIQSVNDALEPSSTHEVLGLSLVEPVSNNYYSPHVLPRALDHVSRQRVLGREVAAEYGGAVVAPSTRLAHRGSPSRRQDGD